MAERHAFKQIEGAERLKNSKKIKQEIMGNLYLYKNLFQILELFSSNFNDSIREMFVGGQQTDRGVNGTLPTSGKAPED